MKVKLTDLDLNFNSSENGRISFSKQELIYDNLFDYVFELDATEETEWEDVKEELISQVSQLTEMDVYYLDYEIVK